MTVTIELSPEVGDWVNRKLASKEFASAEEFIQSCLYHDWVEEKIDEAMQEPPSPITSDDWAAAHRRLEQRISRGQ